MNGLHLFFHFLVIYLFGRLYHTGMEQSHKFFWFDTVFVENPTLDCGYKTIGEEVYVELINIFLIKELAHELSLQGQEHFTKMLTEGVLPLNFECLAVKLRHEIPRRLYDA